MILFLQQELLYEVTLASFPPHELEISPHPSFSLFQIEKNER